MSAVPLQLPLVPDFVNFSGKVITNATTGDDQVTVPAGTAGVVMCRFSLPRSTTSGLGSRLDGVAINYNVVSGTLSSVTPTLTQYTYIDTVDAASASVPLNAASPAAALAVNATSRPVAAVTTPAYDNVVATRTRTFLLSWSFVAAAGADVVLNLYNMEALYAYTPVYNNQLSSTPIALNTTGVLTAAMITGGIVTSTTAAGVSATTDSATNIVAAVAGAVVGQTLGLMVVNTGPNSFTFLAGAGVTLVMGNVAVATLTSRAVRVRIDNVGTPAVTIYG